MFPFTLFHVALLLSTSRQWHSCRPACPTRTFCRKFRGLSLTGHFIDSQLSIQSYLSSAKDKLKILLINFENPTLIALEHSDSALITETINPETIFPCIMSPFTALKLKLQTFMGAVMGGPGEEFRRKWYSTCPPSLTYPTFFFWLTYCLICKLFSGTPHRNTSI